MTDPIPTDLLDHKLPDWYRATIVDVDGDLIATRKAAIEDLANEISLRDAPGVVAYAHNRIKYGKGLINWIREAARRHDGAFAGKYTELEPRVMVACAIAHRMASKPNDNVSIALALMCLSASFRGFTSAIKSQKLSPLARGYLLSASETARAGYRRSSTTALAGVKEKASSLPTFSEDAGSQPSSAQMAEWTSGAVAVIQTLARRIDTIDRGIAKLSQATAADLDQTGWLLDEYCEIAGKPWAGVAKDAAPIFAATELAAISDTAGLANAPVMLKSTLVKAGQDPSAKGDSLGSVTKTGQKLDSWPESDGHDLLPLLAAVGAFRELNGKSGWRALAEKRRGGGNFTSVSLIDVAEQGHRELLVSRVLSHG